MSLFLIRLVIFIFIFHSAVFPRPPELVDISFNGSGQAVQYPYWPVIHSHTLELCQAVNGCIIVVDKVIISPDIRVKLYPSGTSH